MLKAASRAFATFLLMAAAAIGEEEKPSAQEGWQRLFREQAAAYQIECGDSGRAELIREPVLQWSLPARGGQHGAIFLWVKDGLPIAIGTLNIWPLDNGAQRVAHELHSLSQTPLSAVWQTRKWTPPKDSVQWRRLDVKIAAPAGRDQRLRRMRDLAGEFTARSRDYNNRQSVLRLLPRPLYRYDLEAAEAEHPREVLDGAIAQMVTVAACLHSEVVRYGPGSAIFSAGFGPAKIAGSSHPQMPGQERKVRFHATWLLQCGARDGVGSTSFSRFRQAVLEALFSRGGQCGNFVAVRRWGLFCGCAVA